MSTLRHSGYKESSPYTLELSHTPLLLWNSLSSNLTYNRAVDCTALHRLFQVNLTVSANGTHLVLNRLTFLLAPWDPIIHSMRKRVLHFHLPLMSNTKDQSTQNSIATHIGLLASQQQQYGHIDEQKKGDDWSTTVNNWLGLQQFALFLKLCGVARKSKLIPICKRMAGAKNSEWVATL